ncbi:MAG TPA: Xaa-Pro peptidase family protein [Bacillota bacterium]|nr:Xaa-Pro peptidase family protein [Bacillota bacterium]
MADLSISREEYLDRRARVTAALEREGVAAMLLFNSTSIAYLTAFAFIPTERPAALVLERGRASLYLPRLDQEHAEETAIVDHVRTYPEYPGEHHPMRGLADFLRELGLASDSLAADAPGYGSGMGYEGPRLEEVLPSVKLRLFPKLIERLRMIKSPQEVRLIRESARWGNLAHALLQEYSRPGLSENEIAMRASLEATQAMIRTLGSSFEPRGGEGAFAGFRGQIGPNSALPHAITRNLRLRPGDVLVTGASAAVWGYHSELERTMFVGKPDPQQQRFFDLMVEMQDLAFASIRPGLPCSEVDRAVRSFFDRHDLWPNWRHHVGHALGMLGHEAPFFDIGDATIIEPGMVFSVEPGLYVPGLGGFRHSDTLVVTGEGIELLTYYPRDLDSMICG